MRISRSLTILGSVLIMTLGAMWIADAAVPDENGNINACYTKPGGTLRVTETGTCKKGEMPISWNQQGVPGEDGVLAPDDLYVRTATVSNDFPDGSHSIRADCDTGDTLLGADGVAVLDSSRWTLDRVSNVGPVRGMLLRVWPTEIGVDPVGSVRALCLDTAQ
jgi:hypothetical protein